MTQIGNSGRLAAKASILQDHIDGNANVHEASAIILDPPIEINLSEQPNVRFAIQTLSDFIDEINIDASTVERGFITLTNDLGGSGASPNVIRFTDNGSNQLNITPRNLVFDNVGATDVEIKYNTSSTTPKGIKLIAQSAINPGTNGADVTIQSGNRNTSSGSNRRGKIFLNLHTENILTAKHMTLNSYIISFFGEPTSTNIPGEANKCIFIFDTNDPSANPLGGSHIYSYLGQVKVANQNGDKFNVGDTPATWFNHTFNEGFGVINKITTIITQGDSPEILFEYQYERGNECTVFVETTLIAALGLDSIIYKLYASFYFDGLDFYEIESNTTEYFQQDSGSMISITYPEITSSGNYIIVNSGYHDDPIKWFANTKLSIIEK